jgi:uncharacterized protein YoxC
LNPNEVKQKEADTTKAIAAVREGLLVAQAIIERPKFNEIVEDLPQKVSEIQEVIKQFDFLDNCHYLAESFTDEYVKDCDAKDTMQELTDEIGEFIEKRDSFLDEYTENIGNLNRMTEGVAMLGESFKELLNTLHGKGAA